MQLSINTILNGTLNVSLVSKEELETYMSNSVEDKNLSKRYHEKIFCISNDMLLYPNPSYGISGIICNNKNDLHLIRTLAVSIHMLREIKDKIFIELNFKPNQTNKILSDYKTERIDELKRSNDEVFFLPSESWYLHRIIQTNESTAYQSLENLKLMAEPYAIEQYLN